MKTDDLIGLLAQDAEPVASHAIEQRFAVAALAGLGGGLVLMLVLFGVRPGVVQDMALPMFWGKLGFAGLLAAGALGLASTAQARNDVYWSVGVGGPAAVSCSAI